MTFYHRMACYCHQILVGTQHRWKPVNYYCYCQSLYCCQFSSEMLPAPSHITIFYETYYMHCAEGTMEDDVLFLTGFAREHFSY